MENKYHKPVYPIGIVAEMLKICAATLRIWEKRGLITPKRLGKNRYYSQCEVDRLEYIKDLLQNKHINIEGIKAIIQTKQCWDIKNCSLEVRDRCSVYQEHMALSNN